MSRIFEEDYNLDIESLDCNNGKKVEFIVFNQKTIDQKIKTYQSEGKRLRIDYVTRMDSKRWIADHWNGEEKSWFEAEYFMEHWETRVKMMADMISPDSRNVMDLGCGEAKLKNIVTSELEYIGVDYCDRDGVGNIICDFNKKEFPEIKVDTSFLSGCLEYIEDYQWFVEQVCTHTIKEVILSYCILELFRDVNTRMAIGQKCLITMRELDALFYKNDFVLQESQFWNNTPIFKFVRR